EVRAAAGRNHGPPAQRSVRGQGVMIFIDCARHAVIRSITRACPNGRNEAVISRARSDTSTVRPPGSPRPQRFSLLLCRPVAGLYSRVDLARTRTGKERAPLRT